MSKNNTPAAAAETTAPAGLHGELGPLKVDYDGATLDATLGPVALHHDEKHTVAKAGALSFDYVRGDGLHIKSGEAELYTIKEEDVLAMLKEVREKGGELLARIGGEVDNLLKGAHTMKLTQEAELAPAVVEQ